jgi:site-specific recombinase XerD
MAHRTRQLARRRHQPRPVPQRPRWPTVGRRGYDILTGLAEEANLQVGRDADFTPHVLCHSAGTAMIRDGEDIVTVAEILGHSVETARRYSLPTEAGKQRAIRRIPVDE